MSFKRGEADSSSLSNLRKRRIADLLSEDIPEHEARFETNGRLMCLVCRHRPIFDTMHVLTVHRQGKKHQYWAEQQATEKHELESLKQKRAHEYFTKHGTMPAYYTSEGTSKDKALGFKSVPYNSRSKKTGRKPRLDLSDEVLTRDISHNATPLTSLPGYSGNRSQSHVQTSHGLHENKPDSSDTRLNESKSEEKRKSSNKQFSELAKKAKTINEYVRLQKVQEASEPRVVRPYGSRTFVPRTDTKFNSKTYAGQSGKHMASTNRAIEHKPDTLNNTVIAKSALNEGNCCCVVEMPNSEDKSKGSQQRSQIKKQTDCKIELPLHKESSSSSQSHGEQTRTLYNVSQTGSEKNESATDNQLAETSVTSAEKQNQGQRYLQALQAGWIKDRSGQWVRDPDVEFDSDEEPPPL